MIEDLWHNIPEFPGFKELSLEDKPLFDRMFTQYPPSISEFTFTNLFIWRHAYRIKISRLDHLICLLSDREEESFFFPPIGEGDVVKCLIEWTLYLKGRTIPPKIERVPEEMALGKDWGREGFVVKLDPDQSDYIYLTQDLIKLEGRKYHRKRNHIKQFKEKYPYQYISLNPEWIPQCLQLSTEWCDLRHCEATPGLMQESIAIKEAFTHFEKLGVKGGAILIDGKVEAFTLGEPLNPETVVIHIEKANPAFEGLYAVINQAFLEKEWSAYSYVNREQDLGQEGLRKAKESYFPSHRINKYTFRLKE